MYSYFVTRIQRIQGKCLSVWYTESTLNLGLFAVHKIVLEYVERIYAYMNAKRHKTMYISVNNNTIIKFFRFFLFLLYGMG
jgi:hypothetical protein